MRLRIGVEIPRLPIIYRHRFLSFIKRAVEVADPDYYMRWFRDRNPRNFSFAVLLPGKKESRKETVNLSPGSSQSIEETVFYLKEPIRWIITTHDSVLAGKLVNGFLRNSVHPFNDHITMKILSIDVEDIPPVKTDSVILKTLSPILVEDVNHIPVLPWEPLFQRELNQIMDSLLRSLRGEGLKKPLLFEPIDMRKSVVKHKLEKFRRGSGKPYMFLTASSGTFRLMGDPEDLSFILKSGIGLRRAQGFGTLDIA